MPGGFTVRTSALRSASGQMAGLQHECQQLGGQVAATLTGLAQAAGGGQLSGALERMAGIGIQRFLDASAVFQHTSEGLTQNADSYDSAEAGIVREAGAVQRGVQQAGVVPPGVQP